MNRQINIFEKFNLAFFIYGYDWKKILNPQNEMIKVKIKVLIIDKLSVNTNSIAVELNSITPPMKWYKLPSIKFLMIPLNKENIIMLIDI